MSPQQRRCGMHLQEASSASMSLDGIILAIVLIAIGLPSWLIAGLGYSRRRDLRVR
jgi:hypothetical protein